MKIEFKEGVLEYANGECHWKNEGKPIDVDEGFGKELLATPYFQEAKPEVKKEEKPKEKK